MKYTWLEVDYNALTCDELSQKFGCKIKSITKGGIIVGYQNSIDLKGNRVQIPIFRQGIEIELEEETPEILAELDRQFQNLKRKDGKNIADEVGQLKVELEKIKDDIKKLKEK